MDIDGQGADSHSGALLPFRQSPNGQALTCRPAQLTLVHRGLGQTLNKAFDYGGRKLEIFGGRLEYELGRGAAAKGEKIDKRFGEDPGEHIKKLDLLFDALHGQTLSEGDQKWIDEIENLCYAILKCIGPEKRLEAQVQAFKEIVRLCTSYPPIRRLFLRSKYLPQFPKDDVSKPIVIWENDNSSQLPEWDFYQELASCSLVGHGSTMLTESCRASDFCQSELGSCVIQQLVSMLDDTAVDGSWRMLTIRYISSFLRLKCFWELQDDSMWPILRELLTAGRKLFEELSRLLSSTQEILAQCPFDMYGLDTLVQRLLLGIEQLPQATDPTSVRVIRVVYSKQGIIYVCSLLDELDDNLAIVKKFLSRTHQALTQIPNIRRHQPDKVTDESFRLNDATNKLSSASSLGDAYVASNEAAKASVSKAATKEVTEASPPIPLTAPIRNPVSVRKRIIVGCDAYEDGMGRPPSRHSNSNILKLSKMLSHTDARLSPPIPQIVFYQSGIRQNQSMDVPYLAKVQEAYTFITHNYQPGDEIFLFGFSQGAYIACIVAGIIGEIGILDNKSLDIFAEIFVAYMNRSTFLTKFNTPNAPGRLRVAADGDSFTIKVLGLFDTVNIFSKLSSDPLLGLPDRLLGDHIQYGFHAMALDESRADYADVVKFRRSETGWANGQILKQVWFSGSHSDIGGGYQLHDLSDLTLVWMAASIDSLLAIDIGYIEKLLPGRHPWGTQLPHDPRTGIFKLARASTRALPSPAGSLDATQEYIHPSVLEQTQLSRTLRNLISSNPDLIVSLLPLEEQIKAKWLDKSG